MMATSELGYTGEERQAWTDILINYWSDPAYRKKLRENPFAMLGANSTIMGSTGKCFPLPDVPDAIKDLIKDGGIEGIKKKLREGTYFEEMMGGNFPAEGDQSNREDLREAWINILANAWINKDFRDRLRQDPKSTLEKEDYQVIKDSNGKFFPLSEQLPAQLSGNLPEDEEEIRAKLDESDGEQYFGWMMMCCR